MNISTQTIAALKTAYNINFQDANGNQTEPNKATNIVIGFDAAFENYIGKDVKCPSKKEVTFDYVVEKIAEKSEFVNLINKVKSLIKFSNGISFYPTSYGIGVFVFAEMQSQVSEIKNEVDAALLKNGIQYSKEYSEAGWVLRYRISKSKENIAKLA